MKKILKIFGFILAILAVLIIVIAIALPILFPPAKVKALIEKQAADRLHRQVKLGKISVSLWSGLSVDNFSLSEAPDFSKGTFVSSERFVVRPRLLPLLAKKIFVKDIELIKPDVTVVRYSDGKTYNFSSLTASSTNDTSSKSAKANDAATVFLISKASIESGKFKFVDQSPAAQSMDARDLNLTVRNFTLAGPVDLKTSATIRFKGLQFNIDFTGMVNSIKGSAKIKKLVISDKGSKISVSGDADNFYGNEPKLDIAVEIPGIEPSFITAFTGPLPSVKFPGPLSGTANIKGSPSSIDLTGKFNLGKLSVSTGGKVKSPSNGPLQLNLKVETNEFMMNDLAAILPAAAPPAGVVVKTPMKASMDISGTPDNTNIRNIRFDMAPFQVTGDGNYKSTGKDSSYVFDIKTNTFPLEEVGKIMASVQEYQLGGKCTVVAKVFSTAAGPDVKGTANLQGATASFKGAKISNIASSIDFTMTDASGKLTADDLKHDYLSGKKLEAKWNLKNAADMAKISGPATMKMGPGEFQNIQKLTSDSKAAKILFLPLTLLQKIGKAANGAIKIPSLDKMAYKEMTGDYTLKPGVMNINSFNLVGDVGSTMKGTVGLVGTQPLNLQVQMKLKAGLIGGTLGAAFANEQGETVVNMFVKGTVDNPDVTVDKKDVEKKVLNTIKDQLNNDQTKEKVKDLLKGLFNR